MMRELTAKERKDYAALQQVIFYAQKCVLDIRRVGRVDAPGTKCLVPEDVIDALKDYIEEMKHTQECILVRAGEEEEEEDEEASLAAARLNSVRYEQDYERGCDA